MAKLKKSLGLFEMSIYGIGVILGAGIYALIGETAALAGNLTWLAFVIGAVIALFTGLSYAELSSMYPRAGGEYIYTEKAFGKRVAFVVGWLLLFVGAVAAAAVALGFGGYFNALFGVPIALSAIGLIAVFSIINFWGIKESARFNVLFTLIEASGLFLIIFLGFKFIGNVDYFELPPLGTAGIVSAAALIFFAFIGFEQVVNLAEETKKAKRIVPKALIIAMIFTTIIYILVSIAAVSLLKWQDLAASSAPLAEAAAAAFGPNAFLLLSVIALFATANTVLILMIATSRILYGMASNDSYLPKWLSKIHPTRKTPWVAVIVIMLLAMFFASFKDIRSVASLTNVAVFITFVLINITLIYLRYKKPKHERAFKVPLNVGKFPIIALLGAVTSFLMLTQFDLTVLLGGVGILIAGLLVYEVLELENKSKWFKRKKRKKRK